MTNKAQDVNILLKLTPEDINKMTFNELRKSVSILASAANKRLKRLATSGVGQMSPAYIMAQKRAYTGIAGGKFGVAGKDINQLRNEYAAIRAYMSQKTSTVKGFKQVRKKLYKRIGGSFESAPDPVAAEREFWATYRKLEELHPELASMRYGSNEVMRDLRRVMETGARDPLSVMEEKIKVEYEKEQAELAEDFSDFW